MLTPTQIQRMCTNYYVADYEVRVTLMCETSHRSIVYHRLQSPQRSSVSSLHGFHPTTATTTYFLRQRPRRLARTSCHSLGRFLVWKLTFPHTSMSHISGDSRLW